MNRENPIEEPQDGAINDAGAGAGDEVTWQDLADAGETAPAAVRPAPAPFPIRETPEFLLDVRLTLSVEVGRVQMPVREVMELGPGSVVELQRAAGEPVEIHANGRCIGLGEIVVVGDQFGVRITELGVAP